MAKKTNISDKELDRDLVNLNLPEPDMSPEDSIDDLSFYGEATKKLLKDQLTKKD